MLLFFFLYLLYIYYNKIFIKNQLRMFYPAFSSARRTLCTPIIAHFAPLKPMHWRFKYPFPIWSCPLITTMRTFKSDELFHMLLLCYYVNDKVLLTYPAFRFRSVLVRSAFPQLSGLMLFIHPTFLSAGAASDGRSFYGVDEEEWSPTLLRELVSQTSASTQFRHNHHINGELLAIIFLLLI